jgi:glycosyltransferase involved in cell wall biosynthesis
VRRSDVEVAELRLGLVTLGDPSRRTGGYRYHRMMAAAAADHGAELRIGSVPSMPWPIPALPAAWRVRAAAEGSDAILLDSITAAFVAPWIGGVRPPVIAVAHQPPGGLGHGRVRASAQRALDGVAYRAAAGIIVAGEGLIDDLRAIGIASERIAFVPPGCDVPVAAGPPLDLRRGRDASLLCVANWAPPKGILQLVEAFATLPPPSATLWLVGETDTERGYAERVRRRISAPDLRDRVVVRGSVPIEEVGRLYRSADVFALCSFADAYGTAWAEALAAGLPVVGWRAGNLPRLAEQGREALMVEPGDAAGLASALRAITSDRSLRDRLAAGARRRAQTLPTWTATADRFFAAVRGFLRSRSTSR